MNKKHLLIISLIVLLGLGLAGAGLYKYQHTNKGISLQTALVQRDAARSQLAVAKQKNADLKQVSDYNTSQDKLRLTSVCTSLKTTKVINQYCK